MQMNQLLDNSILKYWLAACSGTFLFVFGACGRFFSSQYLRTSKPVVEIPEKVEKAIYLIISLGLSIYGFVHIFTFAHSNTSSPAKKEIVSQGSTTSALGTSDRTWEGSAVLMMAAIRAPLTLRVGLSTATGEQPSDWHGRRWAFIQRMSSRNGIWKFSMY